MDIENFQGEVYGQFHLAMPIQKTSLENENGEKKMTIAGVASGVSTDLENDRMTEAALGAFQKAVEFGLVDKEGVHSLIPLMTGHRKEWSDKLGWVTKATIDENNNLWIEAELDETSSIARDLFHKLQVGSRPGKPLKLGFSVGGFITKARKEFDVLTKKNIRIIEDVLLDEISVVGSPAFAPSFLDVLTKSTKWESVPTYYENQGDESMNLLEAARQAKEEVLAEMQKNESVNSVTAQVAQNAPAVAADAVNTDDVINVEAAQVDPIVVDEAAVAAANNEVVANADAVVAQAQADQAAQENANPPVAASADVATNEGALKELQDQVRALTDSVTALLAAQQNGNVEQGIAKSVTEVETVQEAPEVKPEVLTKSTQDFVAEAMTNALLAFKSEYLDPMISEIREVRKSVDEVAATPMDKSIAVRESPNATTIEDFRKRLTAPQAVGTSVNPIRASLEASLNRNA